MNPSCVAENRVRPHVAHACRRKPGTRRDGYSSGFELGFPEEKCPPGKVYLVETLHRRAGVKKRLPRTGDCSSGPLQGAGSDLLIINKDKEWCAGTLVILGDFSGRPGSN